MKVSKYDAGRDVYYDVEVEDLEKEYESLKLNEKEVAKKIKEIHEEIADQVATVVGAEKVNIKEDKNGKIDIEVKK